MRGEPTAVEAIDSAQWIGVPTVVLGELHAGFSAGSHTQRNEDQLARFLAHPVVEELPVDHEVARIYGEIVHALRRKGTPLPTSDIWVAATTARAGATLLAVDAHFDAIDRVGVLQLG